MTDRATEIAAARERVAEAWSQLLTAEHRYKQARQALARLEWDGEHEEARR